MPCSCYLSGEVAWSCPSCTSPRPPLSPAGAASFLLLFAWVCEGSCGGHRLAKARSCPVLHTTLHLRRRLLLVMAATSARVWLRCCFGERAEVSRRVLPDTAPVPAATDSRSQAFMACRRPYLRDFGPDTPVAGTPSSVFGLPVFWRLRLWQLGATLPSSSSAVPVTIPPSMPAFYHAAFPTLSTPTACRFQSSCSFGSRCSPANSVLGWWSTCRLSFSSLDPDLAAMGLFGLRPGKIHVRLADAGRGETRECRFPSWRRCHGLYPCPSSSIGGNPRSGSSDRMAAASRRHTPS
ncbi:hypothetical protein VPH35_025977 [Triticum aestivum]